jgi:hypothetical protein
VRSCKGTGSKGARLCARAKERGRKGHGCALVQRNESTPTHGRWCHARHPAVAPELTRGTSATIWGAICWPPRPPHPSTPLITGGYLWGSVSLVWRGGGAVVTDVPVPVLAGSRCHHPCNFRVVAWVVARVTFAAHSAPLFRPLDANDTPPYCRSAII